MDDDTLEANKPNYYYFTHDTEIVGQDPRCLGLNERLRRSKHETSITLGLEVDPGSHTVWQENYEGSEKLLFKILDELGLMQWISLYDVCLKGPSDFLREKNIPLLIVRFSEDNPGGESSPC